jgi:hypothetical protein
VEEVQLERLLPVLGRGFKQRTTRAAADICDEEIDSAKRSGAFVHEALSLPGRRDVGHDAMRLGSAGTEFCENQVERLSLTAAYTYTSAFTRQPPHYGSTDATASAGDQPDLASKSEIQGSLMLGARLRWRQSAAGPPRHAGTYN